MRSQKFLFYSLAALLAVLVFMVYFDIAVYGGVDGLRPWYYDVIEHFIGGVIVAGLYIYYAYVRQVDQFPRKFWIALFGAVAFVAVIAVFWEFYEFSSNIIFHVKQNSLPDTVKDLVMGLLGAVCGSLLILPKVLKK